MAAEVVLRLSETQYPLRSDRDVASKANTLVTLGKGFLLLPTSLVLLGFLSFLVLTWLLLEVSFLALQECSSMTRST